MVVTEVVKLNQDKSKFFIQFGKIMGMMIIIIHSYLCKAQEWFQ